jgi:hypothetical protein
MALSRLHRGRGPGLAMNTLGCSTFDGPLGSDGTDGTDGSSDEFDSRTEVAGRIQDTFTRDLNNCGKSSQGRTSGLKHRHVIRSTGKPVLGGSARSCKDLRSNQALIHSQMLLRGFGQKTDFLSKKGRWISIACEQDALEKKYLDVSVGPFRRREVKELVMCEKSRNLLCVSFITTGRLLWQIEAIKHFPGLIKFAQYNRDEDSSKSPVL